MNIPHILAEITNSPLFITPAKLAVVMEILNRKSGFALGFDQKLLSPGPDMQAATIPAQRDMNEGGDQIAVVNMIGSMVSRNAGFSDGSGLRSYRGIQHDVQLALNDAEIGGILLDIDSFGGSAAGCERLARFIHEADKIKPIYGVVDLHCFSAGYYVAAGCRKVIITDGASGGVGSIGCIGLYRGQVKKDEMDGYEYEVFTFGDKKGDGNPHQPLDDRVRKLMQANVEEYGMQFSRTMAEFRGLKLEKILEMQAGYFYGQPGIDMGLADEIMPFSEAVAMMADEIEQSRKTTITGGSAMTTQERIEALLKNEDGPEALEAIGYVKAEDAAVAAREEGLREGHQAGMKQALEVAQVAELGSMDADVVVSMLEKNMDMGQARETVQGIKAAVAAKAGVTSTISYDTKDGKHPLVAACQALNN